jgi:hypothetical protein
MFACPGTGIDLALVSPENSLRPEDYAGALLHTRGASATPVVARIAPMAIAVGQKPSPCLSVSSLPRSVRRRSLLGGCKQTHNFARQHRRSHLWRPLQTGASYPRECKSFPGVNEQIGGCKPQIPFGSLARKFRPAVASKRTT